MTFMFVGSMQESKESRTILIIVVVVMAMAMAMREIVVHRINQVMFNPLTAIPLILLLPLMSHDSLPTQQNLHYPLLHRQTVGSLIAARTRI